MLPVRGSNVIEYKPHGELSMFINFVYDERKQENIPVYIPCDQRSLQSS